MLLFNKKYLLAAIVCHAAASQAYAVSEWNRETTYAEPGQIVIYKGQLYKNKWWIKGENPAQSGSWGGWTKVASTAAPSAKPTPAISAAPSPKATVAPTPKATVAPSPKATAAPSPTATAAPTPKATVAPSPKATATPITTPTLSPSASPKPTVSPTPQAVQTAPAWHPQRTYDRNNTLVSYQGQLYRNLWWTRGETPGQANSAWRLVGATATLAPSPVLTPAPSTAPTASSKPIPKLTPTAAPAATPAPSKAPAVTAAPSPTPIADLINPPRTLTLEQPGDIGQLREAQLRSFNHTPMQSTGYWVQPGDVLVVSYVYSGSAPNRKPEIWLHNIDDNTWNYDTAQKVELKVGSNTIISRVKAAVYVAAFNTPTSGELKVELVSGGRAMPRFVLGQHTQEDWLKMLTRHGDAPYAELLSKRMMITTSLGKAMRHVDDPEALMTLWDKIVQLEEEQYGIKPGNRWPHQPTSHRYHFVELAPYDGWMYAWQYRMATVSADDAIGTLLNSKKLKTDGWGPWHELGHLQQLSAFTWTDQTEVTVNLSSAYVQRALGQPSRYEVEGVWIKTMAYLAQGNRDFAKQDDVFVRATMFWQLDLAFGKDFYAKLATNYRNMAPENRPANNIDEQQTFIIEASRVAAYDLTPFFSQWGIAASAGTKNKLRGMALKTLTDPIWLNRDSKVLYQPR